ncbi:hypothetical protein R1flu_022394 [Riccia fluitans]|uniref:Uncharacterized protein n=1 Tax=Riccia fluitans TaxID=41844 RepID=A0ABD1ZT71_9MARC
MSHSPNLDKLDQEASIQNIDRLVEALEMEAKESGMSKRRKLFLEEASTSAVEVYQPLAREEALTSTVQVYQSLERSIVPSFPNYGITLEELSMLSRDEVFPYVNTHRLKIDGIIKISGELFQPIGSNTGTTSECIIDLSAVGLRKLVDFPVKGECRRIVPPSEVEVEFLKQTGRKYKKDAWQDIAPWFGFSSTHSQPRSEGWVVHDFKKYSLEGHPDGYALDKQVRLVINQVQRMVRKANRSFYSTALVLLAVAHVDPRMANYRPNWHMWVSSEIQSRLGHGRKDTFLGGKFCEGWEAIVRIVTADFVAKQATARHEPLLLEARNAFTNTRAEWDCEKGELVREREALKEELNKAKEMAAEAEQRMEAVRLEKEAL